MTTNVVRKPSLKACFLLGNVAHGCGGHSRSLKTTVEALQRKIECTVIDIGFRPSPVIASTKVKSYHVYYNGLNLWSAFRRIGRIIAEEEADVLHVFNSNVFFLARLMSIACHKPLLLTKCGGPSPRKYFPCADQIVVYHMQDLDYFTSHSKFRDSQIHFIPNRVTRAQSNPSRIAGLRSRLRAGGKTFLRIARFAPEYLPSMMQSINLVNRLNREGHACQLALIGAPQEPQVLEEVARRENENIRVFYGEEFTVDAHELIDAAEFVIGTGRGFMEAASRGRVLLTPLCEENLPLLVTEETFHRVFATNFSPRNRVDDYDEEANYRAIVRALKDPSFTRELCRQSIDYFERYFNIDHVIDKHERIARSAHLAKKLRPADLALSAYLSLRAYVPRCIRAGGVFGQRVGRMAPT